MRYHVTDSMTPEWRRSPVVAILVLGLVAWAASGSGEPLASQRSLAASANEPSSVTTATLQDELELEEVLGRLSRLARLYRDEALSFACRETITDTWYGANDRVRRHRSWELDYIYVYNDPTAVGAEAEESGLVDYRTRPGEDELGTGEPVDIADLGLSSYLERAYSWALLFQRARQHVFEYRIVGPDEALDREAIVVEFEPIPPYRRAINEWFGKIWVDRETFQPLRVEAMRSEDVNEAAAAREAEERQAIEKEAYRVLRVTTEFGVEKNGMRFPSEIVLEGSELRPKSNTGGLLAFSWDVVRTGNLQERKVFEARQKYSDYRFFSVRTEAEVRDMVLGRRKVRRKKVPQ